jgi:hypothetical protein
VPIRSISSKYHEVPAEGSSKKGERGKVKVDFASDQEDGSGKRDQIRAEVMANIDSDGCRRIPKNTHTQSGRQRRQSCALFKHIDCVFHQLGVYLIASPGFSSD